ncbi:MAG TPA: hypothetical protein VNO79_01255 [Actinomycetota bacterium]|nr:hypothetical protein [Actinomycetota bacterium]
MFESSDGPVEVVFRRCTAGHVHPALLPAEDSPGFTDVLDRLGARCDVPPGSDAP